MSKEFISSGIPWFISGSRWYGLPHKTIAFKLFSFIFSNAFSPWVWISFLKFSCSIVALSTALLIFDFEILKYIESSSYNLDFNFSLLFKLKNGFMYVILFFLIPSTLFFITSEYDITTGKIIKIFIYKRDGKTVSIIKEIDPETGKITSIVNKISTEISENTAQIKAIEKINNHIENMHSKKEDVSTLLDSLYQKKMRFDNIIND